MAESKQGKVDKQQTMNDSRAKGLYRDQIGMASIMVTIILMLVITLIVLGFAQVIRREQRQSLDQQLYTQAFYAAETGVNDAVKVIQEGYNRDKTKCGWNQSPDLTLNAAWTIKANSNEVDAGAGVEYTCLLIDQSPPTLVYDNIDTNRSTVINVKPSPAGSISHVTLSWHEKTGGTDVSGCKALAPNSNFPAINKWEELGPCKPGVLRVDLVPTGGSIDRASLTANAFTGFLYPKTGPGTAGGTVLGYASGKGFGKQGVIHAADCHANSGDRFCTVTIDGLAASEYTIRVKSIYSSSALTVSAKVAGVATDLIGAQAVIDSTGKANDVLRRIRVHVPLDRGSNAIYPEFAIETMGTLCKRVRVAPGISPDFDPTTGCPPSP